MQFLNFIVREDDMKEMNRMNEVMNEGGSSRGIMMAAITGAALGAGVALLFAPCSGKDTRGWLADRGRQLKQKSTRMYEQGVQAVRRTTSDAMNPDDGRSYAR
jgi:hypothetical protein